jgi:abhydrolase domain-containing protein 12
VGKTLNLNLKTSDNVTLGAWFILSDAYYQSLPLRNPPVGRFPKEHIPSALTFHPTVIFFHGNGATRAVGYRVRICAAFSSRLHANVLTVDYRGFADSQGHPTEAGLALDARAAWDWVIGHGARPEDVLIVGHSLGTAVAARLSSELSEEGIRFKGTVLLGPFSSITRLMDTYNMMGFLPITKPLTMIPGGFGEFFRYSINQ